MGQIFLSYAREDRACAERLARVLETAGHDVWWDRRLEGGEEFSAEIEAELSKAGVVLVAWSKESVNSRWVRDEAAVGCESGRLIPVTIDGSLAPMGFRQFHTLDLTGWKAARRDKRTAELVHAVERRLQGKAEHAGAVRAATPARRFAFVPSRRFLVVAAVVLLLIAVGTGYFLLRGADKSSGQPLKPTIALLPFTTATPDPELRALGSQARDSLAHTFSQSGLPLRLMNTVPQGGRAKVDFFFTGEFSRTGDKVVATIRLEEAEHRVTVFSHKFEASRDDAPNLPERIGAQMAGNLTWRHPLMKLDRRHPIEPTLLAELLQGDDFTAGLDNLQQYQSLKRIAANAPDLLVAQTGHAFTTAFVLPLLPRGERGEAVAEARLAAERAFKLGPDHGDTYGAWCYLQSDTRRAECEDRLRAGMRIDPDAPFLNTFLSHLLRDVGRFDEAIEVARLAHTHDVYVPTKIAWMLKSLEYAGEGEQARELYEQGMRWWPEFRDMFFRNRMYGLLQRGDFGAIRQLEQDLGAKNLPSGYQDSGALVGALKSKSIAAARRACPATDGYYLILRCFIVLASLGDQDGAYAITDKLYLRRLGRTAAETEQIWLDEPEAAATEFVTSPAAAPLRRDPRYLALAERTGLLAYWRTNRLPDFCRKQPEPICARIRRG